LADPPAVRTATGRALARWRGRSGAGRVRTCGTRRRGCGTGTEAVRSVAGPSPAPLACGTGRVRRLVVRVVVGAGWLVALIGRYVTATPTMPGWSPSRSNWAAHRHEGTAEAWRKAALRRLAGVLVLGHRAVGHDIRHDIHLRAARGATGGSSAGSWCWPSSAALCAHPSSVRTLRSRCRAGTGEPYPLADAHTRAEVAGLRVAGAAGGEGRATHGADTARQPWGWEASVILKRALLRK